MVYNLEICSNVQGNFQGIMGNPSEILHAGCRICGV